jgi:2-methylcitrate dehydratase PrpD
MITKELANFIIQTNYSDIPKETVLKAKMCFLDFLGVSIVGSNTKSRNILNSLKAHGGSSSIINGENTFPLDACLINGVAAHSLDLDDGHRLAAVHPGATVIPAALALAEDSNICGEDFLTALIVGYQITVFMGKLVNPIHRAKGFHTTGTCGTFGAAAAAAKILKIGYEEVVNALGLAGTQAAGLLQSDHSGSMAKHLHTGKAAHSGVLSVLLAEKGFSGAWNIIEGKEGFLKAMASDVSDDKMQILRQELFNSYYIDGVYFKKYPVCRHLHSAIDGLLILINKYGINRQEIENITIKTYKVASSHDNYRPNSSEAIRQSLPVSVALALYHGHLSPTNLNMDEEVLVLTDKVQIECDNDFEAIYPEKRAAKIIIQTDLEKFSETIYLAEGEPEKPFTWDDLLKKFQDLNPHYNMKSLEIIKNLDKQTMKDVMNILDSSGELNEHR